MEILFILEKNKIFCLFIKNMPARRTKPQRKSKGKARKGITAGVLTTVNRSLQPFPNRYICKMKYATSVITGALSGQYIMNLNSLYDPDRSGVGRQPYGFDNLATLYNRYRVIATGWRIQQPNGASGSPVMTVCLPNNDVSITYADFGTMTENPRSRYIIQNPGAPVVTLNGKVSLPKLVGRTPAQYMADDNYQAVVNADPSETALLYINTFNGFNGAIQGSIGIQVLLEFTVEFFDLKHVVPS